MAAESILVNGATEILKNLSAFVAEEIGLAWGVKDELQKLKKTLDMILAVMTDAEKKQLKSEAVRLWLQELKDIAYEAEDIMDEYAYEVMHQRQMNRKRDKVRNFFSSSNAIVFRPKIAHEIKAVNEKFNEIAKRKQNLGLEIIELGTPSRTTNLDETSKLRETDSTLDLSLKMVGRKIDKSNIINILLHNYPHNQGVNIQVIPIVGMGGLGKTTLAQLIYDDDKVKSHFDLKMWVCVSDDFDVKKLFVKIIESITNYKCADVSNIEVITRQVQQHLREKKYLLVLDDVWNKKRDAWENFRKHLLVGGTGSKILVTTRSDSVASIMGGGLHSYKLGFLTENESWSLFKERAAFGHVGGIAETQTLTTIGKELVGKCGGLPLAIIFLGSLLRGKEEIEWTVINENQIWNQSSNEDESRILPILKLSYDHLPSHLKQCFSYFSLFPKDYEFLRLKMFLMWMAEGFILQPSERSNKSMEEVGNEYFNILLNNSFFQVLEKDDVEQVKSFKIHDLVHDLAKDVVGDRDCLLLATHENLKTIPNVRRLRLQDFNEGMSKTVCKAWQDQTKLRTLLCDGTVKKVENAFNGLKRLRVLELLETPNIEEIPSSLMDNLKHLRFLNVSNTQITNLPESLTRLYHLQTLGLLDCVNLKVLPKGIGKLINLRYLYLPDDINLPREIGKLSSLRALYPCNVGNKDREDIGSAGREGGDFGIKDLEGLNLLTEILGINNLRNVRSKKEAQRANLMGKKKLSGISLNWHKYNSPTRKDEINDEYSKEEAVLEALQPHPNLKLFAIDQYFGVKLPRWMGDPSGLPNLVKLQLRGCPKCEQLVGFGKLPSLKVLKLFKMDGIKCLGNEFYYDNSGGGGGGGGGGAGVILFPSLKELILSDMGALEEWVDIPTVSCFPCLEEIHIYGCPNLTITPTTCFPSLKVLYLSEINGRLIVPLITTNLNSLESVILEKITELRLLPYRLLKGNKVKDLKVYDCLDFQGFLTSKEEEGLAEVDHQNEEEEEGGFTSLEVLGLVRLPALKFLPDLRSFTSLEKLDIQDCKSFKPLPENLTCLPSYLVDLHRVGIKNVKEVEDFEWQKYLNKQTKSTE